MKNKIKYLLNEFSKKTLVIVFDGGKIDNLFSNFFSVVDEKYHFTIILTRTPGKECLKLVPSSLQYRCNIIDCLYPKPAKANKNIYYLGSLSRLTELSICINECIKNNNYSQILLFESPSILTEYNPLNVSISFFESILLRVKSRDISLISFGLPLRDPKLDILYDKIIKVENEI